MAVFGIVSSLAGFVKIRYLIDRAIIDNMIFRAHYRITSAILFGCCLLVSANNLIGDPINCISDNAVPNHVINTFCWITYTFTLPNQEHVFNSNHAAHPGLGVDYQQKTFHSYYQWVPFMLFFQGVMFYLPHWMWKQWEEGKVRMISDGMRGVCVQLENKSERRGRIGRLVQYISDTMHLHNSYAAGYFFCEFLNFVNVVGNIYMMDAFLGGAFLTYGTDVIKYSNMNQEQRIDPMVEVFPRVTKCTFHKYGPSGSIQKLDALCVLALNILNEKIYIFLWFWFIILAAMTGVALVYSAGLLMMPKIRETVLRKKFKYGTKEAVKNLVRKMQIGDFMLLHLLGQNMNAIAYNELLMELTHQISLDSSSGNSPTSVPSAPSTLEMAPMYPDIDKLSKDTEI